MIYTFKGLRDQVLRLIDESDSVSTDTLVKELMNQAYQQRVSERAWNFMIHPTIVGFSTVAGQRTYVLHQEFGRPLYFYNKTTKRFLTEMPLRQVSDDVWALTSTEPMGSVDSFIFQGTSPVQNQPTTLAPVSVVSTSASDTGSTYQIVVKGEDENGVVFAEVLQLNGTTPVSSSASFYKILGVTKTQNFNGTITLTSGTTTLVSLLPWEMGRQYRTIYFLENPMGGEEIEYRFYRQPVALVNDHDIPDLPGPYMQVLVWDTLMLLAGGYLSDVSPQQIETWRNQQTSWEFSLYSHEMEGQSLGAFPVLAKSLRGE